MDLLVEIILVLSVIKYCLKASLNIRLRTVLAFAVFAALFSLAIFPVVIEQPVTIIEQLLSSRKFVSNGALIVTVEAIAGIFVAVGLLDNYFMPEEKRKKTLYFLKIVPGVISLFAFAYFELVFVSVRIGREFWATAILYSLTVFLVVVAGSYLLRYIVGGESRKLELKVLLNMAVLAIGLLINSSVAEYNLSNATAVVDWKALLSIFGIGAALFFLGLYLPKIYRNIKNK